MDGVGVLVAVLVGVGVAVAGSVGTALSAAAAFTMPLPQFDALQLLPEGKERAVLCRICTTCVKLSVGLNDSINDTTPVTCGAAVAR